MSDMDEFSPCPFCGSTDLVLVHLSTGVKCKSCGMVSMISNVPGKKADRVSYLASCWNRRA